MNPLLYLPIRNTFKLPVNTASKCMPIEILSPNYDHSSFHFLRLPFTSGKFHFLIGANMALIERSPKTRPQNSTKKIGEDKNWRIEAVVVRSFPRSPSISQHFPRFPSAVSAFFPLLRSLSSGCFRAQCSEQCGLSWALLLVYWLH